MYVSEQQKYVFMLKYRHKSEKKSSKTRSAVSGRILDNPLQIFKVKKSIKTI